MTDSEEEDENERDVEEEGDDEEKREDEPVELSALLERADALHAKEMERGEGLAPMLEKKDQVSVVADTTSSIAILHLADLSLSAWGSLIIAVVSASVSSHWHTSNMDRIFSHVKRKLYEAQAGAQNRRRRHR